MRKDILSLSLQELEILTSKGTVSRAVKEVESDIQGEWKETQDGNTEVVWEDSVTCILPEAASIQDFVCTCPSAGICRHIVRTVVAYQKRSAADEPKLSWNPGDIDDESLRSFLSASSLAKAKSVFDSGIAIELDRTETPTAKIEGLGNVFFPVPNDVKYARSDRKGSIGEQAVAIAVWAFRLTQKNKGFVSTERKKTGIPIHITDGADIALKEIVEYGFQSVSSERIRNALSDLERSCIREGLLWPADVLAELREEYSKYLIHDSQFDPNQIIYLLGEWFVRTDALKKNKGEIPFSMIAGDTKKYSSELTARTLIGLGSDVRVFKKGFTVRSYFTTPSSDEVLLCERFLERPVEEPFHAAGNLPAFKGIPLIEFGKSSIVSASVKRTASGKLQFGNKAVSNPHTLRLESLHEGIFYDDYDKAIRTISQRPPQALGPRSAAGNFLVLKADRFDPPYFDDVAQRIKLEVEDKNGTAAYVSFPYYSRAVNGLENLRQSLFDSSLCYLCGIASSVSGKLHIQPVSVVIEQNGDRTMLQPYLDSKTSTSDFSMSSRSFSEPDPLKEYIAELTSAVSDLCMVGLKRYDQTNLWKRLIQRSNSLGLGKITILLESVFHEMQNSGKKDVSPVLTLTALLCLSRDVEIPS
ncbi:hypothetical protein LEP1GSC043_1937 [Leptospira weilii str. Ecochallenge]|uniref:SWIM-type domain-containing protein n=1 Tax=Leptospira weilii str. Ecochallenge TaxID=1049986 RepID=N1U6F9_9LEPT|nr:hypothetical protein LEP1GSC043_1937 [Leptospira weilii str. Ecochallenge]